MALTKARSSIIKDSLLSVTDFGSNSAAFTAALAASDIVVVPDGDFFIDSQVTIPANKTVIIRGKLKPANNTVSSGTAMLNIVGSDVLIEFQDDGGIDGISSSYSNWNGISAGYQSTRLENIHIKNGTFTNIALTNTDASAISFGECDDSSITNNNIFNCGTTTTLGGGFGIYLQYCGRCKVEGNNLDTVGATGINDSCSFDNIISNNTLKKISLFGMKGGYGPNAATVTSDVTPTIYTFSINATADTRKRFVQGAACEIFNAAVPNPIAYISAVSDNGSYLQIFVNKTMVAAPDVAAEVQMLSKGTIFSNNSVSQTGDNGWDYNGWCEINCIGNTLNECGAYTGAGSFGGLAAGFWFGYDPQGAYNKMRCEGLNINNNFINNTYGSGISCMSTIDDVAIIGNTIINSNRMSNAAYGGIEVCRLGYYLSNRHAITNNFISGAGNGISISSSFTERVHINGNTVSGNNGIKVNSSRKAHVMGNHITYSDTSGSGYGILVSDDSTSNPTSIFSAKGNVIYSPNSGYGIRNTDAGISLDDVFDKNTFYGTNIAFSNNGSDTAYAASMTNSAYSERHTTSFATGQTITFNKVNYSTANMYLLAVQSEQNATTGLTGLYLISRSTTSAQITAISACADVTVALNGSYQVTVTNSSGGNRTVVASLTVIM